MGALQFPAIDQAIGNFEGFGTPGAPTITGANNPGALQYGPFAAAHGATGASGTFATFPDLATGLSAEDSLVQRYANNGATIEDLLNAWAPGNAPGNTPQQTANYIASVSGAVGATPQTPVSSLQGVQPTPAQSGNAFSRFMQGLFQPPPPVSAQAQAALGGYLTQSNITGSGPSTFSWSRIGAFLLGLIMIAGGIYLFKDVQEIVNRGVRAGTRAAIV